MAGMAQIQTQDKTWDRLVDRYFDEAVFPFAPSSATSNGFHQWDTKLEDLSRNAVERQASAMRRFEREIDNYKEQAPDRDLVLSHIHANLLALESIRMSEKNPDAIRALPAPI